jgi:hypothetical protein
MIAHQPLDGIGALVATRNWSIARALALAGGHVDLGLAQLEAIIGVGLGLFNLLAGQLPVLDRVDTHDAAGDVAIGNALDFERVQRAEGSDLLE